jgi:putative selenate reductase molybdopterin-binding subunit
LVDLNTVEAVSLPTSRDELWPLGAEDAVLAGGTWLFTMDFSVDGLLHLAVLGSPLPHARIVSIDTSAAQAIPGVHMVLTHRDSPPVAFSTARHDNRADDPDDTLVLDSTVRFIGQRVAAVVADSLAIAEKACRAISVENEELPAVFSPEAALTPGAPLLHGDKGHDSRIVDASRNLVAELYGEVGPSRRASRRRSRRYRPMAHATGPARAHGDARLYRLAG